MIQKLKVSDGMGLKSKDRLELANILEAVTANYRPLQLIRGHYSFIILTVSTAVSVALVSFKTPVTLVGLVWTDIMPRSECLENMAVIPHAATHKYLG